MVIVGDLNIPQSTIDRPSGKKSTKKFSIIGHYRPNGLERHLQNISSNSHRTQKIFSQQPMELSPWALLLLLL
jgi:hypothetical protein